MAMFGRDGFRPEKENSKAMEPYAHLTISKKKARCTGVELGGIFVTPECHEAMNLKAVQKGISIGDYITRLVKADNSTR